MAAGFSTSVERTLELMDQPLLGDSALDLRSLGDVRDAHDGSYGSWCTYKRLHYSRMLDGVYMGAQFCGHLVGYWASLYHYSCVKDQWEARVHRSTPAIAALDASCGHGGCMHCLSREAMLPDGCEDDDSWETLVRDNPDFVPYLVWAFNCSYHSPPKDTFLVRAAAEVVTLCSPTRLLAPQLRPMPSVRPMFLHRGVLDSAYIQCIRLRSSLDKTILPDILGVVGKLLEPVRGLSPTARGRMVEIHARCAVLMMTAPNLIAMMRRSIPVRALEDGGADDPNEGDGKMAPQDDGLPASSSNHGPSGGGPQQPEAASTTVKVVDGKFLLTHAHEGIELGRSVPHWHECINCGDAFSHKHQKRDPIVSSTHYTHHCRACAKTVRDNGGIMQSSRGEGEDAPPQEVVGETHAAPVDPPADIPPMVLPEENRPLPLGYISPQGPFPTRPDVSVQKKDVEGCKKNDVKASRKSASTEAIWRLYDSGQHAEAKRALDERAEELGGNGRHAYHFIGHDTPGLEVFVSSGHDANFLQAAGARHFKAKDPKDPTALKDLERVSGLVVKHIIDLMKQNNTLQQAAATMEACPESFKSKKWMNNRFKKVMVKMALDLSCVKASAKTGLPRPRNISIKLNEALAKIKPRLIMAAGDEGTLVHLFDAAIIEFALFHLEAYEERSIKHAGLDSKCARMHKMMGRFATCASMDFGAFDGSIDAEIRGIIENKLVKEMADLYLIDSPLHDAAVTDRCKQSFKGHFGKFCVKTSNMIRESGDRGTSIFNYVTNIVLFVYGLFRERTHQLMNHVDPEKRITNRGHAKNEAEKYVKRWLASPDEREADITGEGDDGAQFFTSAFIEEAARVVDAYLPGSDAGSRPIVFMERWVQYYTDVGFSIEPQGPMGALRTDLALRSTSERLEFISTVWVRTPLRTYCLPKPVKTATGACVSFAVDTPVEVAAYTKMVSIMDNCIHCPIQFEYFSMQARFWEAQGGSFDDLALEAYKREQLSERRIDSIRESHRKFLLQDGAVEAVRDAYYRETGIPVETQVLLESAYRSCDVGAIPAHSRAYYVMLRMTGAAASSGLVV